MQCRHREPSATVVTYYFASAAVAVDFSHMTASSSASWSRFSPPWNFVNGHVSTMWFMVCRWPQLQEGDWARPHLCKLGPWPVVTDSEVIISDHLSGPYRAIGSVCVCVSCLRSDNKFWTIFHAMPAKQQNLSICRLWEQTGVRGARWCHLANTTERIVRGGDAVLCQITLTTCYLLHRCRPNDCTYGIVRL